MCVTIDEVWTGECIYWQIVHTTRNHKWLQRHCWSPYFTIHYTLRLFPTCYVTNSCFLATAPNSEDSSASRANVLTARRISRNWTQVAALGSSLYSLEGDPTKTSRTDFLFFYGRLLNDRPDIVDVFKDRYWVTHVLSRDRCLATALHITIFILKILNYCRSLTISFMPLSCNVAIRIKPIMKVTYILHIRIPPIGVYRSPYSHTHCILGTICVDPFVCGDNRGWNHQVDGKCNDWLKCMWVEAVSSKKLLVFRNISIYCRMFEDK
jgi:hypothetical protein